MTLTLRLWAGVLLNKTLELYLSSYQIWIKSIQWSGKYKLLKNFNVNMDADANSDADAGLVR